MSSKKSLSRRCVLVKEVPEEVKEECICSIRGIEKSHRHHELSIGNGEVKWIVLLTSEEVAENLLKEGYVTLDSDGKKLDLPVGGCPERIIPVEWIDKSPKPDLSFINTMKDSISMLNIGLREEGKRAHDLDDNTNSKVEKEKVEEIPEERESQDIYIPSFVIPPITSSHKSTVTQVTEFPSDKSQREGMKDISGFSICTLNFKETETLIKDDHVNLDLKGQKSNLPDVGNPECIIPDEWTENKQTRSNDAVGSEQTCKRMNPQNQHGVMLTQPEPSSGMMYAQKQIGVMPQGFMVGRQSDNQPIQDFQPLRYPDFPRSFFPFQQLSVQENMVPPTGDRIPMPEPELPSSCTEMEKQSSKTGMKKKRVVMSRTKRRFAGRSEQGAPEEKETDKEMKMENNKDVWDVTGDKVKITQSDVKVAGEVLNSPVKMAELESDLLPGEIKFFVMKGDVTKLRVDVIVNAASGDLDHRRGLALAISRAGGNSIQQESKAYIKSNGTVPDGDAIPAKPGNLTCEMLIHAVGPRWQGGNNEEEVKLRQAILKCLELTDKNNYCSIAIPALSAGNSGYPMDQSARTIVSSIQFHFRSKEGKSSKIKKIYFCDVEEKIVIAFIRCLRRNFGHGVKEYYGDKDLDIRDRKFRELNVEVRQGDITQEKTDAIVSCISENLDFNVGAVCKAVLRAAGDRILAECRREGQSLSKEGYVVTSGGNIDCKYIIHVKGQRSAEGWERMVTKALAHADKTGCRSISFPALGTGVVDIDPAEISKCMFRAISKFPPVNLQTVRVIVFQSKMLPVFKSTLQALSQIPLPQTMDNFTRKTRVDIGFDDKDETSISSPWHRDKNLVHGHMINRGQGYGQKEKDGKCMAPSHSNSMESISGFDRKNEYELKDIDVSKYMLRDNQIDEIKRIAKDTKIVVKDGKIELLGLATNVNEAAVAIYKYLHEVKDQESAKTIQKYVKWQYEAWPDKWSTFSDYDNLQIENAHQARKDSCIVKNSKGTEYVIDFNKMEEHDKNYYWKKYKIKRVEGFPVGLPTTWTSMKNNQTVVEITLNHWDNEYQEVMSRFKASSKSSVKVSEIRRVQNPFLYQQYVVKRKEIEVKNGKDPQQWLWHGTYPDTVDKVINNGFNRGYCGRNGTRYGAGVYFAVNASYSAGYSRLDSDGLKHMFSVQVATGAHCVGNSSMNVLPPKHGAGSHVTYDSASDNLCNPEMYVIFHDSQAYPAYHIIFR